VSGRHNVSAVLHRKPVAIEIHLVYQIILSDVMRTLNVIETNVSTAILQHHAKLTIVTRSGVTGKHSAFDW
jgi:hypothetical protein